MIIYYHMYFDIFQLALEVSEPKDQEVPLGLISPACYLHCRKHAHPVNKLCAGSSFSF